MRLRDKKELCEQSRGHLGFRVHRIVTARSGLEGETYLK